MYMFHYDENKKMIHTYSQANYNYFYYKMEMTSNLTYEI